MKKKTNKKAGNFAARSFKFIFKCIFVYPFKGIWWVLKHSVQAFTEELRKSKERRRQEKAEQEMKKLKARARGKGISSAQEERKAVSRREVPDNKKIERAEQENTPEYNPLKELKNKKGSLGSFEDKLYHNKSTIGIILGARGTGKSAIGMRLLENFFVNTEKKIYAMGFKQAALPAWIRVVKNIEEIENDAVILIDEAGIEFSSRESMSKANKMLSDLLLISRHKDLSLLVIAQNSGNLELNVIRQSDYFLLKPSSLMQLDFERKKIKDIYEKVKKEFEELSADQGLTYIYSNEYCGFVINSLPSFWSEKVSKGYADK